MKVVKPKQVTVAYKPSGFRPSPATYYNNYGYLVTAANNEIRFGYHPKTLQYLGAIVEDQSTNLLTYSEAFDNVVWNRTAISTVSANTDISPTGAVSSDYVVPNTDLSNHALYRTITLSATAGQTYTFSVYAKPGLNWVQLRFAGTSSASKPYAFFNIQDGYVGTTSGLLSADIEGLPNGWNRISITRTIAVSGTLDIEVHVKTADNQGSWSGNGSSGILFFGAQAELKQKMTSYISTTSTTATRQPDYNNTSSLVYTSTLNTESEWNSAGVTYVFGQYVSVNTYSNDSIAKSISDEQSGKYLCLTTHVSNSTNGPLQSTTNWARVGPTNQFAMFDTKVSTQTKQYTGGLFNTDPLVVTFCLTSEIDTISLINISGAYVDVAVSDGTYSQEYFYNVMLANRYDTYDNDTETQTDSITVTNIPKKSTVFVTIKVSPRGIYTPAAVGIAVQGEAKFLGSSQYGVTAGIVDYSRKETDEFGNTSLTVRNFAKKLNAKLFIDKPQINDVQQYLYSLRATPALWVASDDSEYSVPLNIYGFYKDFSTEISYVTAAVCNLDIEGLT